ncbi:FAD-dependent oxidoreductase [Fundicoccus culcitae]|uniref:FAD-dependent oxidoreductase n=1 Tax=Fundicoccus culcitae TaxID=2969821 RepID=A0ABY5P313_9LACT|nr:FAD-dependent oxidoreductase [Fundicoccus culcitae]UUX33049.1 FAD-dependent oxidoreductase [Fundicoccus culcitae]
MEKFDTIIIGFGKAGKTLANFLNKKGETVALIEQSPKMYGGTCINVACLPSKNLIIAAERKPENTDNSQYYTQAVQNKKAIISQLNQGNYHNVADLDKAQVIDGRAFFKDPHTITIKTDSNASLDVYGNKIIINTGSLPTIPEKIENLSELVKKGKPFYTSETLMDEENYPETLTIIGDGFIGLEFASMFNQFGTQVTILSHHKQSAFLAKEDTEVAEAVYTAMVSQGIKFIFEAHTVKAQAKEGQAILSYKQNEEEIDIVSEAVLVAVGRHANTQGLALENAGVEINDNQSIKINKYLQTTQDHIFAVGDVNGGPQHTYISLDDNRILQSYLYGDKSYHLDNRKQTPSATFIEPPLASVGLTEKQATAAGYQIKTAVLEVKDIPKAKIAYRTTGIYKAVVDAQTNQILGVRLFGEEAHEMINIVVTAMNANLPYTDLRDQIYTHPTMSEALNDLFGKIE